MNLAAVSSSPDSDEPTIRASTMEETHKEYLRLAVRSLYQHRNQVESKGKVMRFHFCKPHTVDRGTFHFSIRVFQSGSCAYSSINACHFRARIPDNNRSSCTHRYNSACVEIRLSVPMGFSPSGGRASYIKFETSYGDFWAHLIVFSESAKNSICCWGRGTLSAYHNRREGCTKAS